MTAYETALNLHRQGKLAEAADAYRAILAAEPKDFAVLHMLGVLMSQQGQAQEAERLMAAALTANPLYVEAHSDRGAALMALQRPAEALRAFETALLIEPKFLPALANKAAALMDLGRDADALACVDDALAMRKDIAVLWSSRGNALAKLGRTEDALASFDQALARNPRLAGALDGRAKCLRKLGRAEEALGAFTALLHAAPTYPEAPGNLFGMELRCAVWEGYAEASAYITGQIRASVPAQSPRAFLLHASDPADQLLCACHYAAGRFRAPQLWAAQVRARERIRVAYVSSDFRDHIVGQLVAGLIRAHDRARFEIIGVSHGPDDKSAARAALEQAFDRFIDVRDRSDPEAVETARALGVDVAVDLNGYTEGERARLFALRIAPVQVGYLGYPGTLGTSGGAPVLDYILGDAHVIPPEQERFYAEKVVRLPGTFFAAGPAPIAAGVPSRAISGLPEQGFVFACFNAANKINPPVFDVWMGLLRKTPGAVLWLRADKEIVARNLRAEAEKRGVDPARLVFAPRVALEAHLARHALADLFLDTWPYNAHGTAAHALWAGLPLVTFAMGGFAGRVSESLLNAVGLPELVARTAEDYAALALDIAAHPEKAGALREKLARGRATSALFDANKLARRLERAYAMMHRRAAAGEAPAAFAVGTDDA